MTKEILHTFIEAHAHSSPDVIAVQQECGFKVNYRELNERANQLASFLTEQGVAKGDVLGVMMSPGCTYVISILSAMKLGAIAMPIDPAHPLQRIAYMVGECAPTIVIGDRESLDVLGQIQADRVALVAHDRRDFSLRFLKQEGESHSIDLLKQPSQDVTTNLSGSDPCYIMYTSGSTGRPKPILGIYKGLSHFIHWEAKELDVNSSVRVSFLAGITFDVSLRDIFLPLFVGGTLCVPHQRTRTSPTTFLDWLRWERISVLHCVPSFLRELLHAGDEELMPNELPQLRYLMSAGEALYGSDVRRCKEHFGSHLEVINLYGPSETTLAKAFFRTGGVSLDDHEIVPLGKPIANAALLLIKDGRLCSIGEIGEIYIKTPFMTKGYYQNDVLTKENFVINPITKDPSDIIYKTGDLGRYLEDRSVSIVGRLDRQVKVNGIRVELEEVEQAVREYPLVNQAVVTAPEKRKGEVCLVAYYTASEHIEEAVLREYLQSRLPSGMCPHYLVALENFPLNLNGKVNVKALPQPEELLYRNTKYVSPDDETQGQLATIWSEVLSLKKVGIDSKFLELGGDSLKAIRVVSRISKQLGVDVTLKDFFAAETIRELARLIDSVERHTAERIEPIEIQDSYPLSAAQRRFWILDKINPGSIAHNIPDAFIVEGTFNREAFSKAWDFLIDRHESLRTSFHSIDGEPRQVVHDSAKLCVEEIDLSQEKLDDKELEARVLEKVRESSFELHTAPLVRVSLFHLEANRHLLLSNIHHIIADGWSMGVLVKEFIHCYESYAQEVSPDLPPLRIQYKDYASWQNAVLEREGAKRSHHYWKEKLSGELPILQIPTDFERPELQTFEGSTFVSVFSHDISEAVKTCAREQGVSLYMFLLAAVKSLLYRHTQQEDIIVGTPVAGRVHSDIEDQMGLFVNMLALRDTVSGSMQFSNLLQDIKQTTTEAFDHQMYPFDRLVEDLDVRRDMSRSPVYDVMVALQNMDVDDLNMYGLTVEKFSLDDVISRNDLTFLFAEEDDSQIHVGINYNTNLFKRERILEFSKQLHVFVQAIVKNPDQQIESVSLLDPDAYQLLRGKAEEIHAVKDSKETLCSLFERQVQRFSKNVALVSDSGSLSYQELHRRSDVVAARLLGRGDCSPGDVVALECNRSFDSMIALLGILKAGCVYLPLDPKLPNGRRQFMVEDSRARCVVHVSTLSEHTTYAVPSVLFSEIDCTDENIGECPAGLVSPTSGAYIIYTSGSTGKPKGVMIEHRCIVNTITMMIKDWGVQVSDCVLQFASPGFDASVSEIFMALLSGATLAIAEQDVLDLPDRFLAFLSRHTVSVLTLPPVYLSLLNKAAMPTVRTLISAGEEARKRDVLHYAQTKSVINAYGPTECSICVSYHFVSPEKEYLQRIPIGKAIQNTQILVCSSDGKPVAPGVIGELCVSGKGLSQGYLHRPELTSEKFISHPLCSGLSLYRTGDRGRQHVDGSIEYLGRVDSQVKISGQRVELEEIAHAIRRHEDVHDVVVLMQQQESEAQLTAYVVPEQHMELWPSVAEFYVYDDVLYSSMAEHEERNARYRAVFNRCLSGKTVVEVGPGAEAVLSRMCIEAGARRVYAIELLEETYKKAKAKVASLGLEDSIIVIHGDARNCTLPEKVDYCISEIVGAIGGSEGSGEIINASRRFLKNPENMIPQRSCTRIAAVALEDDVVQRGFSSVAQHYVDEIFSATGRPFDLRVCLKHMKSDMVISSSDVFEDLDYRSHIPSSWEHDIELSFQKEGICSGFVVWLELFIDEDESIDIMQSSESWLPIYVPLDEMVQVAPGDVIHAKICRSLCENGLNPDFCVDGVFRSVSGEQRSFHCDVPHIADAHRRNTFYQMLFDAQGAEEPLSDRVLRNHCRSHLPEAHIPRRFVEVERIPLTANGKVDSNALACIQRNSPEEDVVGRVSRNEQEMLLTSLWEELLHKEGISIDDNFFSLGGDSIKAIQIVSRLGAMGHVLEVKDIFHYPTIAELAEQIKTGDGKQQNELCHGEVRLTPIQHWAFQTMPEKLNTFVQTTTLIAPERLEIDTFRKALTCVIEHHDSLRLRYHISNQEIRQEYDESASFVLVQDVSDGELPVARYLSSLIDRMTAQMSLSGPLVHVALAEHSGKQYVCLVVNHLLVDTVSWGIICEDLCTSYDLIQKGEPVVLASKTASYQQFADALSSAMNGEKIAKSLQHWNEVLTKPHDSIVIQEESQRSYEIQTLLSSTRTDKLVSQTYQAYGMQIHELLLAALSEAMNASFGGRRYLVELESHGRGQSYHSLNLSRTVGWFTAVYPVLLERATFEHLGDRLKAIKELLRAVPDEGQSYGMLRYLSDSMKDRVDVKAEIGFNYLGSLDTSTLGNHWKPFEGGKAGDIIPKRFHPLDVQIAVIGGELCCGFSVDAALVDRETLEAFVGHFVRSLDMIIDHCAAISEQELTPSDLTQEGMTISDLQDILESI